MNTSSRRSFLKTSVAGAVFSSSGILAATVSAQTKKWDETFDVIVVEASPASLLRLKLKKQEQTSSC